ncbi:DUF664 domain-containing protein [Saccharopolyspora sp. NPDC050389]|uniref:mycothiol transferase n=1 Tax=Saccharopolyspora sp. NPDC050389 TaxID=3155516 RepID=UPI0033E87C74
MFPEPTAPAASRGEVLLRYLDFFRGSVIDKVAALPDAEPRSSRVPSGWTPLELVKHLTFAERRWIDWGFEGRRFENPWGDRADGRWYVAPEETRDDLVAALRDQGRRTSEVVATSEVPVCTFCCYSSRKYTRHSRSLSGVAASSAAARR